MKKTLVVVVMLAVVAVVLAGGAAYMVQQNKLGELRRLAVQAEEKLDSGDFDGAIQLLKRVDSEGGSARSAFLLGKAYYAQGKLADGIRYFERIEKLYPTAPVLPDALVYRGRYALEVEGKPKTARETFLQIIDRHPDSDAADLALYYLAKISFDAGDTPQTKRNLELIMKRPESPARSDAEFLLGDINMKQLRSPEAGPDDVLYTIKRGDSIWKLERELKVPGDLIVGINNLRPSALTIGTQIKVPRINITITVDKPQRTLTLKNNGVFLKKYRVGLNRADNRVPAGDYVITEKFDKGQEFTDPESGATFKAGDPANPLGNRFLQLRREVGIHGTNDPDAVGKYVPRGCIVMTNQDIEEIYSLARKGTPVTIKGKNLVEGSPGKN